MSEAELEKLRAVKEKLVKKLFDLRDEFKRNEKKPRGRDIQLEELFSKQYGDSKSSDDSSSNDKDTTRCSDILQSILGVQFENLDKHWIRDNIYCYKAQVITKAFRFSIDLTVDVQIDGYTIEDINCHFVNLDKCYLQEITPWIDRFTKEKNFSYLISGVSDYNEQSMIRAKILWTLEKSDYITMEQCQDDGGGIYAYVHPPGDGDLVFFRFCWSLKFIDRNWRMEHMFDINSIAAGENFVKTNHDLLNGFCRMGIRKNELEKLWTQLCAAIDKVV